MIHHLVCTDGSKGTWDPDVDVGRCSPLVARSNSAKLHDVLLDRNAGEVRFLGRVDGELDSDLADA